MKKILVPTDFSKVAEYALDFAIELAKDNSADICVMHAIDMPTIYEGGMTLQGIAGQYLDEMEVEAERKLDELLLKKNINELKVSKVICIGGVLQSTKNVMVDEAIDLVVMGTRGCTGLEELLIGSNTEKIVRHADCPVISIPADFVNHKVNKILVPLDLREIKPSFLREVGKLQVEFNAKLQFMWVQTPHNIENNDQVKEDVAEILNDHEITDFEFSIVRDVFPADGIISFANEVNADLIAMATHARRGFAHWFSGSLTEDTINHINLPVWSFKLEKGEASLHMDSVDKAEGIPAYRDISLV